MLCNERRKERDVVLTSPLFFIVIYKMLSPSTYCDRNRCSPS